MYSIYKYTLALTDKQALDLPKGSRIMAAKEQHGNIVLYALVPVKEEGVETYAIFVHGTGHLVEAKWGDYIGTVMLHGGALVFHVFATKQ